MFCKNCGCKVQDTTLFCPECGANQKEENNVSINKEVINEKTNQQTMTIQIPNIDKSFITDLKNIFLTFLSEDSFAMFRNCNTKNSLVGCILVILNGLLFSFVSCTNLFQLLNFLLEKIMGKLSSLLGGLGGFVPNIEISATYDLFGVFLLIFVIVLALKITGIYIIKKLYKQKIESFLEVINILGISFIPFIFASILNFVLGYAFPPATLAIFVTALIMHGILLFDGVEYFVGTKKNLLKIFSIFFICLTIILSVFVNFGIDKLLDELVIWLQNSADIAFNDILEFLI